MPAVPRARLAVLGPPAQPLLELRGTAMKRRASRPRSCPTPSSCCALCSTYAVRHLPRASFSHRMSCYRSRCSRPLPPPMTPIQTTGRCATLSSRPSLRPTKRSSSSHPSPYYVEALTHYSTIRSISTPEFAGWACPATCTFTAPCRTPLSPSLTGTSCPRWKRRLPLPYATCAQYARGGSNTSKTLARARTTQILKIKASLR
mmetsp:Transcript_11854/g.36618  ORF Transcript_11854/g.36618 Transcript_11854/m.36618 type:complete len:203 (-) Transcript_11854:647-1255(-)